LTNVNDNNIINLENKEIKMKINIPVIIILAIILFFGLYRIFSGSISQKLTGENVTQKHVEIK
jgi:hypothetical protein